MNNWLLIWCLLGFAGTIYYRYRKPDVFLWDNSVLLTIFAVLMAGGMWLWGGPVFLLYVLLAPEKTLCPHCRRVNVKGSQVCQACSRSLEVFPFEAGQIQEKQEQRANRLEYLARKYEKYIYLSLLIFFIATPALSYLIWKVLLVIADLRFSVIPAGAVYVLLPHPLAWLLVAMFLGIFAAYFPMWAVLKLALRVHYAEYEEYENLRNNTSRMKSSWFFSLGGVMILVTIVLMLNTYMMVFPDQIVIHRTLAFTASRYSFDQVSAVRSSMQLKNAKWDHPIYVVEFADGSRWSTRWQDRDPQLLADLVGYIAERSGRAIQVVPAFQDTDV